MPRALEFAVQLIAAGLVGAFAWRVWQHDKDGPNSRREYWVFVTALAIAITSATGAIASWIGSVQSDAEDLGRFKTQLGTLNNIVGATSQLSDSLRRTLVGVDSTLAYERVQTRKQQDVISSLRIALLGVDSSLAHDRVQSYQQQNLLTSLRAATDSQAVQLSEQRALMSSQQQLAAQNWRQSFPLSFPIGVYAQIEYPADSVQLTVFVDSLEAWSRRMVESKIDSIRQNDRRTGFSREQYTLSGWGEGQAFRYVNFRVDGERLSLDEIWLNHDSRWLRYWGGERWFLLTPELEVQITNRNADPPLELRFSAQADSNGFYQLDRHLSPFSSFTLAVNFRTRTITQRMATQEAFIGFRTASLSVLDLPCSTMWVSIGRGDRHQYGRIVKAAFFFGFTEYQWQLQVPVKRLARSAPVGWHTQIAPKDVFQAVFDHGWARHPGVLRSGRTAVEKC